MGTSSEFTVVPGDRTSAIKFRNVAQPHCYLAIIRGYAVGYVSDSGNLFLREK